MSSVCEYFRNRYTVSVVVLHAFWNAANMELNKTNNKCRYMCMYVCIERKEMKQNVYNW